MRRRGGRAIPAFLLAIPLAGAAPALAIEPLQLDDFEDGTTQGWQSGGSNPSPPIQVPSGGPRGKNDAYLLVRASGSAGSGGNLVAFNQTQWTGDYRAAGVAAVEAQLANLGTTPLVIRLLLEGPGGGFTTQGVALEVGSGWRRAAFSLRPDALVGGTDLAATLMGVTKLRILHSAGGEDAEPVAGSLGVDVVAALDACGAAEAGSLALCRTYCEVLDCDGEAPHAPAAACEVTADLFTRATGETLPCLDADRDGIADPQDNCPLIANGDQADADTDGIGDACDNCPAEPNPGQEDASGEAGVGDACDCPCFTRSDVADLLAQTSDPAVYGEPICIDTDPENKPLTAISVLRLDGAACSDGSQDCSAVAQAFTEDDACQLNPPLPATSVLLQGISAGQRDACSDYIRDGAAAAGLPCL